MAKTASAKTINIAEIHVGDVFSESSHYIVEKVLPSAVQFKHLATEELVTLSKKYVEDLLQTADQYQKEVSVTREDSHKGEPGIRTLFEQIGTSKVFTVGFLKQDTKKTQKAIKEEKEAFVTKADSIIRAKKKGTRDQLVALLNQALDNPVSDVVPGELRTLRGYKTQFISRDGKYNCVDVDIKTGNNIRPVNINTIQFLVVDGVKYTVK